MNANEEPNPFGGYTALQITASKWFIGVASLLLEHGANVNANGARRGERTALESAAENDRIDTVRFLINSGVPVIGSGADQYYQAKNLASSQGHYAVCQLLDTLHEEKGGRELSLPVSSLKGINFDFPSGIPASYDLSNDRLDLTPIEYFSETPDRQPDNTGSAESVAWPDFSLTDIP